MNIEKSDILRLEALARLKLAEGSLGDFAERLSKVFDWIDQLKAVDVTGVRPLPSPVMELISTTPLREDKAVSPPSPAKILENAPEKDFDFFLVPKVIS